MKKGKCRCFLGEEVHAELVMQDSSILRLVKWVHDKGREREMSSAKLRHVITSDDFHAYFYLLPR